MRRSPAWSPASGDEGRQAHAPDLSQERIVREALAIVDSEGLDALSMRRLGAALGVEAMTLYYYFPTKAALLDGLVELVLGQLPLPRPQRGLWEDELRRAVRAFRRLILAHPAVLPLVSVRPAVSRASLRPIARVFTLLQMAGLSRREAASTWAILINYVFGHITSEVGGGGPASRSPAIVRLVQAQEGEDFEAFRAAWATVSDWDGAEEFELGLDVIIAGIRARMLKKRPPKAQASLRLQTGG